MLSVMDSSFETYLKWYCVTEKQSQFMIESITAVLLFKCCLQCLLAVMDSKFNIV
jgi:hypothetical protein